MRKLTIAMSSALIAALSLPALADITLSGSARYRLGAKEDSAVAGADSTSYRNGRLQLVIQGGNDTAGFETNVTSGFSGSTNSDASLSVDDGVAYGWVKMGDATLKVGNYGASTGMGLYGVGRDDRAQAIEISGGNDQFTGFIRSNRGHTAGKFDAGNTKIEALAAGENCATAGAVCEKADFATYGLTANLGGVSFEYQHGNESVSGADDEAVVARNKLLFGYSSFDSLYASATLGTADVGLQVVNTGAKDANAKALRVGLPLDEYDLSLAYATFDANYGDSWAPFGSGILDGAYSNGKLTGSGDVTKEDTRFIGVKLAGDLGDTGLQFAAVMGSFNDQDATTSNSVYDINLSYAVAKGATVKLGMGEANDKSGLGARVDYSF